MTPSRRVAAVALAVLVVTSGCSALPFVGGQSTPAPIRGVPAEADAVAVLEERTLSNATERRLLAALAGQPEGDPSGPLSRVENATGLAPARADRAVVFAALSREAYWGVVLDGDWSTGDVEAAIERTTGETPHRQTLREHALYHLPWRDLELAVLAEGRYVVGTPAAVADTVGVAEGDDPVDGTVARRFGETRAGAPVRFAAAVPSSAPALEPWGLERYLENPALRDLAAVSGAQYATGSRAVARLNLHTDDGDAAADLAHLVRGTANLAGGAGGPARRLLANVTVTRDGRTTTVQVAARPRAVGAAVADLGVRVPDLER